MKILAIETSCDETAITVLDCSGSVESSVFEVLGNTLLSQALEHAEFGGVYPNLAKRLHQENLIPVLKETLKKAGMLEQEEKALEEDEVKKILEREPGLLKQFLEFIPTIKKPALDLIAVTVGPGLEPALWVGINFAKALAYSWNLPLIPVNHMEGHIASVLVSTEEVPNNKSLARTTAVVQSGGQSPKSIELPAVALLISGGHTELVLVRGWGEYELIGQTRDDAVGEAFDKVARILGLAYPGGPEISRLAEKAGNESGIKLPRPMLHSDDFDFSFSGLKTAVLYLVKELGEIEKGVKAEIAREFEDAVTEVLVAKTKRALEEYDAKTLIVGGGVIANKKIRAAFEKLAREADLPRQAGFTLHIPPMELTGDNAVMIGAAAYLKHLRGSTGSTYSGSSGQAGSPQAGSPQVASAKELSAEGNLRLHTTR